MKTNLLPNLLILYILIWAVSVLFGVTLLVLDVKYKLPVCATLYSSVSGVVTKRTYGRTEGGKRWF